jgi:hypothetical protein
MSEVVKLSDKPDERQIQVPVVNVMHAQHDVETDEQVSERIRERFEVLDILADSCFTGISRSLIVSGPPGVGKSHGIGLRMKEHDPDGTNSISVSGYVRTTGMIKILYQYRSAGQVVVFDDADSILRDEDSLTILKRVCDTTRERRVFYASEYQLMTDDGEVIPTSFDFDGAVIYLTNLDFDELIRSRNKMGPHLEAMISRSHYIDMSMKSRRDYMIRIRQVLDEGLLDDLLLPHHRDEVVEFIEQNQARLRELSLRMVLKIAAIHQATTDWRRLARVTCCRN